MHPSKFGSKVALQGFHRMITASNAVDGGGIVFVNFNLRFPLWILPLMVWIKQRLP
jgi:hypothetical protein